MSLFGSDIPFFWLALIAMCAVFAFFTRRSTFDTLSLSITALGIDILLVCGSVRLGLESKSLSGVLIIVGLTAVGALVLSAMTILHLHRNQHREGQDRDESH